LSKTLSVGSVPIWPGFDISVRNVETPTEHKEVGLSHLKGAGLELVLEIEIEAKCHLVLVDSGASLSVMKPGISSSELQPTQTAAGGITGNKLKAAGTQDIILWVGKKTFRHELVIAPLDGEYSGILGVDVLRRMEARVDLRTCTLVLGKTSHRLSGQEVERCALINRQPQAFRDASGTGMITPEPTGPVASVRTPIPGLNSGGSDISDWEVVASGPVVLPPLSRGIVVGKSRGRKKLDVPQEVLVEPNTGGVCDSSGEPGLYLGRVRQVTGPRG
jgi:hypothetical protein